MCFVILAFTMSVFGMKISFLPRFWVRGFEMSHYICEWGEGAVGEDSIHRFMRGGGVKGFQP